MRQTDEYENTIQVSVIDWREFTHRVLSQFAPQRDPLLLLPPGLQVPNKSKKVCSRAGPATKRDCCSTALYSWAEYIIFLQSSKKTHTTVSYISLAMQRSSSEVGKTNNTFGCRQ